MATRARANERAEWVKAMRSPRKTAAGRHTETRDHDRRVHHHESSNHRLFLDFSRRKFVVPAVYVTGLCSVGRVVHPSCGTTPRNAQGRGMVAVLHLVRQSGKTWRPLTFEIWFSVLFLFFYCTFEGRHSGSALDSRRVPLCSRLPACFVRCRQHSRQQPLQSVATSWLVAGTEGSLCCSRVDTRGHVSSVCTMISCHCAPSPSCVFLGGEAS